MNNKIPPKIGRKSKFQLIRMGGELWLTTKYKGGCGLWPRYFAKVKTVKGFWRFIGAI